MEEEAALVLVLQQNNSSSPSGTLHQSNISSDCGSFIHTTLYCFHTHRLPSFIIMSSVTRTKPANRPMETMIIFLTILTVSSIMTWQGVLLGLERDHVETCHAWKQERNKQNISQYDVARRLQAYSSKHTTLPKDDKDLDRVANEECFVWLSNNKLRLIFVIFFASVLLITFFIIIYAWLSSFFPGNDTENHTSSGSGEMSSKGLTTSGQQTDAPLHNDKKTAMDLESGPSDNCRTASARNFSLPLPPQDKGTASTSLSVPTKTPSGTQTEPSMSRMTSIANRPGGRSLDNPRRIPSDKSLCATKDIRPNSWPLKSGVQTNQIPTGRRVQSCGTGQRHISVGDVALQLRPSISVSSGDSVKGGKEGLVLTKVDTLSSSAYSQPGLETLADGENGGTADAV